MYLWDATLKFVFFVIGFKKGIYLFNVDKLCFLLHFYFFRDFAGNVITTVENNAFEGMPELTQL